MPSLALITEAAVKPELILLPCCGMALLTLGQVFRLGAARFANLKARKTSMKYYRLYNTSDGEPEHLAKLSQNVENLFEAPPLFYAACVVLFLVRGAVTPTTVSAAWAYVLFRLLHVVIHTGTNNVTHRFAAYAASTVTLVGLWLAAAHAIVRRL